MAEKQYTFSLPDEAASVIDALPEIEQSRVVSEALLLRERTGQS